MKKVLQVQLWIRSLPELTIFVFEANYKDMMCKEFFCSFEVMLTLYVIVMSSFEVMLAF